MKNPRKETVEKLFLALTEFHRALLAKKCTERKLLHEPTQHPCESS